MPRITPETSVREINVRYPACRAVFAQYGMGGCGGDLGPDEPLNFFAEAHHVDLTRLTAELEAAAEQDVPDTITPALAFEKRLATLYKTYIRTALLITVTLGTAWGAHILAKIAVRQSFSAPNYAGTQAHGHAQLYGWVGLFIMGVAYFSVPKFMQARMRSLTPAWTAFALMLSGIALRALAQPLASRPVFGALALGSALLELAAVLVFVTDIGGVFARSKQPRQRFMWFIYASLAWFAVLAAWNLKLIVPLWLDHAVTIPDRANGRFLYTAVFGFVVNMILGYSLRLLPTFLGLRPVRQKLLIPAFVLFNAGVIARVAGVSIASGVLAFTAMAVYVFALRIFEPPATYVKSRGVDESFPWFIRLAYFWFVVSTSMVLGGDIYRLISGFDPAHIYTGAWRHAVTVGFISTIMVGLGYRLLPLFTGVDLWRPGLMRPAFWLLAIGNFTRVTFQLATATEQRWAYLVMGTSGLMELTALSLFSLSLWKTLSLRQQVLTTGEQINTKTHVRWLLDNFPQAREELIRAGLCKLESVKTVPGFISIQQAATVHGVNADEVVARLREKLKPAEKK